MSEALHPKGTLLTMQKGPARAGKTLLRSFGSKCARCPDLGVPFGRKAPAALSCGCVSQRLAEGVTA